MMACIIAFSGVGGSYIQVEATSVGIPRPNVWNDEVSVWENIKKHINLFMSYSGVYANPSSIAFTAQDFYDFMGDNGYTHEVAHGVFCDCEDSTHTSFNGQEHGGGGFIRDGVTQDDDGNVTYSDDVSDLFHDFITDYIDDSVGYWLYNTPTVQNVSASFFSTPDAYANFKQTVNNLGLCAIYFNTSGTRYVGTIYQTI